MLSTGNMQNLPASSRVPLRIEGGVCTSDYMPARRFLLDLQDPGCESVLFPKGRSGSGYDVVPLKEHPAKKSATSLCRG